MREEKCLLNGKGDLNLELVGTDKVVWANGNRQELSFGEREIKVINFEGQGRCKVVQNSK